MVARDGADHCARPAEHVVLTQAAAPDAGALLRGCRERAKRLEGRYWMAASEGAADLEVSGEPVHAVDRSILDYADTGERSIELRAAIPMTWWSFTFVREDTLITPRDHLRAPPQDAPAEVRAIRPRSL